MVSPDGYSSIVAAADPGDVCKAACAASPSTKYKLIDAVAFVRPGTYVLAVAPMLDVSITSPVFEIENEIHDAIVVAEPPTSNLATPDVPAYAVVLFAISCPP